MKKLSVFVVAALFAFSLATVTYARYVSGFEIIGVAENQVTIQKDNAEPIVVGVNQNKYKVGDKVKYDADKMKIQVQSKKKTFEGC